MKRIFMLILLVAACNVWRAPVQNAKACEYCARYENAGRILKGKHLQEWRRIYDRHRKHCPFVKTR